MILDGKYISSLVKNNIKSHIESLNLKPSLVVIQIGNDEASNIYIKNKEKYALSLGVTFEHIKYEENVSEEEVIKKIEELNKKNDVNGILVQLPLPKKFDSHKIINTIDYTKDVDGLTEANVGKLFSNQDALISCTPAGIMYLLEYYNIEIEGKHVVIVGRSNLVGKPLIQLFLNKDATVTVCHRKTENLKNYTKQADILVVAVGKKYLITSDMVKQGAVVIDVGINKENDKLYGDVDFEKVAKKSSYITPVPGGVGPMTIAMLFTNIIKTYKK
ncbi:MAG: bifunctional 5,10-methylenetetrahydrofolate dehydrogenase/5,10-methenyltetrahydrofolate cyclohydrolase [Bacilli bacterium]|nr:bifunctional 5,10-methylenetetrahydrofolate dehydrogenase/5,10-methenyltetrahydrofolate cyclohydrolase [Bacilli bacterium]MDD4734403.1 bifunctional 5,10-methylenetetrahydrofolate dehydrogenase/5,10-methenyltetrahydrofolate cyclohydrolase [Bacilli bacterium]